MGGIIIIIISAEDAVLFAENERELQKEVSELYSTVDVRGES